MPRKYIPLTKAEKAWRKFLRQNKNHPILLMALGRISQQEGLQQLLKAEKNAESARKRRETIKRKKEQQEGNP